MQVCRSIRLRKIPLQGKNECEDHLIYAMCWTFKKSCNQLDPLVAAIEDRFCLCFFY